MDLSKLSDEEYGREMTNFCRGLTVEEILGKGDRENEINYNSVLCWGVYINSQFTEVYSYVATAVHKHGDGKKIMLLRLLLYREPTKKEVALVDYLVWKLQHRSKTKVEA